MQNVRSTTKIAHFAPKPKLIGVKSIFNILRMNVAAGRRVSRKANFAIAGLLAVFVGGTYYNIISRVSHDDLEAELHRELKAEARKQAKEAAAQS